MFPQGFSCLVVLWIPPCYVRFRVRDFHPVSLVFPVPFCYNFWINYAVLTPKCTHFGLGSSGFARRYSQNRFFFLFLRLLRCFSSPGLLLSLGDMSSTCRVAPFGYLRINSYVLIPAAFRSLSRPSSPLRAKASTIRPYLAFYAFAFYSISFYIFLYIA